MLIDVPDEFVRPEVVYEYTCILNIYLLHTVIYNEEMQSFVNLIRLSILKPYIWMHI